MKIGQKLISISISLMIILLLAIGCKADVEPEIEKKLVKTEDNAQEKDETTVMPSTENLQKVKIEMEDGGVMIFELYPQYAPETVANFLELVESGFYDGLKFHRIIKGFMAQSGDPLGNGTGGADNTIKGEFSYY